MKSFIPATNARIETETSKANLVSTAIVSVRSGIPCRIKAFFVGIAARMMGRVFVDYASNRRCVKRGGHAQQVSLADTLIVSDERSAEIVALDEALKSLEIIDQRKSQIVELRFFAG